MTRIPSHTIEDAPGAVRPLLEAVIQVSPTGRLLNLHAQMAHSPAVLAAYSAIRRATSEHGTLGFPVSSALMLATAGVSGNEYAQAITAALAARAGWGAHQVTALLAGRSTGDGKTDAIVALVREAAARSGLAGDETWARAVAHGWTSGQLTEAFAYLGLTVFTAYFLNYAQTPADLPPPGQAPVPGRAAAATAPE
jgi:hypothetical protein